MDYGMLMSEDLMEAGFLGQHGTAVGAGIGAGVGAAGAGVVWAKKRLSLNKKLKACADDACRAKVKAEIKKLRGKALKYGAATTVAGAGLGAAAGKAGVGTQPAGEVWKGVKNRASKIVKHGTSPTAIVGGIGGGIMGHQWDKARKKKAEQNK